MVSRDEGLVGSYEQLCAGCVCEFVLFNCEFFVLFNCVILFFGGD